MSATKLLLVLQQYQTLVGLVVRAVVTVLLFAFRGCHFLQVVRGFAYHPCYGRTNILNVPAPLLRYQPNDKNNRVVYRLTLYDDMRLGRTRFGAYHGPTFWA